MPRRSAPTRRASGPAGLAPATHEAMRRPLLAWYRRARRDLPWRRTRDPYRIWVSEIMLQQTRVDVVVPYYERFVARFPDVVALARAPIESVLQAWAGLGYYSRARNLHAAARQIVAAHAGRFPRDADAILALPGVGRYTAGAIRSIAFDAPAAILDGNVVRVFARWFGIEADVDAPATRRRLWDAAQRWATCGSPGDANQALMELGALVCTKPVPQCTACPVQTTCVARQLGRERQLPGARRRPAADRIWLETGFVQRDGKLLLVRRRSGRLLQDFWEFPTCVGLPHRDPTASRRRLDARGADGRAMPGTRLATALRARLGIEIASARKLLAVRHSILSHTIAATLFEAVALPESPAASRPRRPAPHSKPEPPPRRVASRPPSRPGSAATPVANLDLDALEIRWVRPEAVARLSLSTLARKAWQERRIE